MTWGGHVGHASGSLAPHPGHLLGSVSVESISDSPEHCLSQVWCPCLHLYLTAAMQSLFDQDLDVLHLAGSCLRDEGISGGFLLPESPVHLIRVLHVPLSMFLRLR